MSKEKDGGQAFPRMDSSMDGSGNIHPYQYEGMSLRDYFAAKAMQTLMDTDTGESVGEAAKRAGITVEEYDYRTHWPMLCASDAYKWADAMLKARDNA